MYLEKKSYIERARYLEIDPNTGLTLCADFVLLSLTVLVFPRCVDWICVFRVVYTRADSSAMSRQRGCLTLDKFFGELLLVWDVAAMEVFT